LTMYLATLDCAIAAPAEGTCTRGSSPVRGKVMLAEFEANSTAVVDSVPDRLSRSTSVRCLSGRVFPFREGDETWMSEIRLSVARSRPIAARSPALSLEYFDRANLSAISIRSTLDFPKSRCLDRISRTLRGFRLVTMDTPSPTEIGSGKAGVRQPRAMLRPGVANPTVSQNFKFYGGRAWQNEKR
jgi:hypothetical protein